MSSHQGSIKWGFNVLGMIFGTFIITSFLYMAKDIERVVFPVIEEFRILDVVNHNDRYEISGTFKKVRQCEFGGMVAYLNEPESDVRRPIAVEFQEIYGDRAAVKQTWGPWFINIYNNYNSNDKINIDFYAHHRCHGFYTTTSKIASFSIVKKSDKYLIEQ